MEQRVTEQVAAPPRVGIAIQRWRHAMGRFVRTQPLGTVGLAFCILAVLVGVFANQLDRYDPDLVRTADRLQGPSAQHWFGTDDLGRDAYSRIVHGTTVSLLVAFFSIGIGTTAGYLFGIVSGYIGGKTDDALQRFIDALLSFPSILLALVIVSVLGVGLDKVVFAIAVGSAPRAARVSRGVVLSVKENVYVDAARVIGASPVRIMLRHILPNSMAPYLILASVALGGAILTEASLSFLGLGVPPPAPSWGRMLSSGATNYALYMPWLMVFPGVAIMILVLGFNLFGDAVRDIWDPRLRGR